MIYPRTSLLFSTVLLAGVASAQQTTMDEDRILEEVMVYGAKNIEVNSRAVEREKDIFSSVITTDDMGDFADQNVAESLRRLPGITLQRTEGEGRFVTVRGLGPGFVTVNMNGNELATAAEDTRAFALDAIPSDLLGSIEVYKTLTPDMDLNSIGGAVNVNAISAYARGGDSLKFKLQGTLQDKRDDLTHKAVFSGTRLNADETFGIGWSISSESRATQVDEIRHHSSGEMIFRQQDVPDDTGPTILAPRQLETRQEIADRDRNAVSLNLEFRPSDRSTYYIQASHTEFEDLDIALREYFDFQDAGSGEVGWVNAETGEFVLSDIDVFHQFFIQDGTNKTTAFSVGGENLFDNGWTLDYNFATSESSWDKPDGRRTQFRERDLVVWGQGFRDNILGRVITPEEGAALGGFDVDDWSSSDIRGDASTLDNFHYDNLFLEQSFRDDDLDSVSVNLTRSFDEGKVNYVKTGFVIKDRSRDRNKDRQSFDPDDGPDGCGGDETCLDMINSNHGDYDNWMPEYSAFVYPFVTYADVERIIANTRGTVLDATNGELSIDSTKEDYVLSEDSQAAYLMAEFELQDDMWLIAGARYEETDLTSRGFFSIENDDFQFYGDDASNLDIAIPMDHPTTSYSDWFPSVHLRWEPREDLLVRGSLWTSFTRPSFGQVRSYAKIDGDIELCVPGTREDNEPGTGDCDDGADSDVTPEELQAYELARDNNMQMGNPALKAMNSLNFDASVSWYADENLFFQAALFYKDIDDFIVDVSGAELALNELPVSLPVGQVTQFYIPSDLVLDDIDLTINGEDARVYGIELSYSQFFDSGFFIQSNLTLLDSEATLPATVRVDKVKLPDQADEVLNLVLGWENEKASVSLITNYRSEVLEQVGACSASVDTSDPTRCKRWADRFQDEILNVDLKAKFRLRDNVSLYFDAINLTDEQDLRYFQGNDLSRGNALYQLEDYGRSYQIGMNLDF
jgi:iron complex outermembrane receptor protein